jgi:hypothetical protein
MSGSIDGNITVEMSSVSIAKLIANTSLRANIPLPALLDACLAACDKDIRFLPAATWQES